jgi:hypothetical protein
MAANQLDATHEADARSAMLVQANTATVGKNGLPRRDVGLPMLNGEAVASLTSCSTNLHGSCDFHMAQKFQIYVDHWRHAAPPHCQQRKGVVRSAAKKQAPAEVFLDRLGVNMGAGVRLQTDTRTQPICDRLT